MENKCDIFDKLKLRKFKIFNISMIDFIGTIIISTIILYLLSKVKLIEFSLINVIIFVILSLILAIIVHKLKGIPTMLNYYLNINDLESVINRRDLCD